MRKRILLHLKQCELDFIFRTANKPDRCYELAVKRHMFLAHRGWKHFLLPLLPSSPNGGSEMSGLKIFSGIAANEIPSWVKFKFVVLAVFMATSVKTFGFDSRGSQFIGFSVFSMLKKAQSERQSILTSPEIVSRIKCDEIVASWNFRQPDGANLKFEVRAIYPEYTTKFYTMGLWLGDPSR